MPIIDSGIEAQIIHNPTALFVGAGNSYHATTFNLANLANDAAGRSRSCGNDERFAGLGLADIEQAVIRGDTV